jgi:macrolide-specific efflux system membrane fusion protein
VANALQVPLTALGESDDKSSNRATVQVVDAKGRARERAATTGLRTATAVQILSGLEAGENVVVGQAPSGAEAEPTCLLGM